MLTFGQTGLIQCLIRFVKRQQFQSIRHAFFFFVFAILILFMEIRSYFDIKLCNFTFTKQIATAYIFKA